MAANKTLRLQKLITRYRAYIIIGFLITILCVVGSLFIYYKYPSDENPAWNELANFLMTMAETILGAGIIVGGIGGGINFIFEEAKKEEEDRKERIKEYQESREKRKLFRWEMQNKLQVAYDNVELARILIKSHKSGKTYGEQIRNRIMPSLISLQDFQRGLKHVHSDDKGLIKHLDHLHVSLNYMLAYLSVLIEEFEANYLTISNLQHYQDAFTNRMRILFTEITEGKKDNLTSLEKKVQFLENAEELFDNIDVPPNIEIVWQAMEELDYISDFIADLRNKEGKKSLYNTYFLQHYTHCNKILRTRDSNISKKLTTRKSFLNNIEKLHQIQEKQNSDSPLTKQDNLTRFIMENELRFDFETGVMKQ